MKTRFVLMTLLFSLQLFSANRISQELEAQYTKETIEKTINYHNRKPQYYERIVNELGPCDCGMASCCCLSSLGCGLLIYNFSGWSSAYCHLPEVYAWLASGAGLTSSTSLILDRTNEIGTIVNKDEEQAVNHREIAALLRAVYKAKITPFSTYFFDDEDNYYYRHLIDFIEAYKKKVDYKNKKTMSDVILFLRALVESGALLPQEELGLNGENPKIGNYVNTSVEALIRRAMELENKAAFIKEANKHKKDLIEKMILAKKNIDKIDCCEDCLKREFESKKDK